MVWSLTLPPGRGNGPRFPVMPSSPSSGSSGPGNGPSAAGDPASDAPPSGAPHPGSRGPSAGVEGEGDPADTGSGEPLAKPGPRSGADPDSAAGPRGRSEADPGTLEGADTAVPRPLARSRTIARVTDDLVRVPGTTWRVGIDPLLGLVPGTGDWIGWAISFHLMIAAAQLGAGAPLLVRMFWNILVDAVTGLVPVAGDVVDAGYKANSRNLRLLEAHVSDPSRTARASRFRVAAVLGGAGLILVGAAWGMYRLARAVLQWVF